MRSFVPAFALVILAASPAFSLDIVVQEGAVAVPARAVIIRPGGGIRADNPNALRPPEGEQLKEVISLKREDLFTLDTNGPWLALDINNGDASTRGQRVVKVSGLEAQSMLGWLFSSRYGTGMGRPEIINFVLHTYRENGTAPSLTISSSSNTGLSLVYVMPGDKPATVTLRQVPPNLPPAARGAATKAGLSLEIMQNGEKKFEGDADDFRSLRLKHARPVARFAAPLFAVLGNPGTAYPSPAEAAQLVGNADMVEPEIAASIKTLIVKLDADSADERDAASKALAQTGWRGLLIVGGLDKKSLTVEQDLRIKSFIEEQAGISVDDLKTYRADRDVLVNVVGVDDEKLAAAAFAELEKLTAKKIAWTFKPAVADRRATLEQLRDLIQK